MSDIPTELEKILKAPMRSEISTADIAIGMWSSTALAEKLVDLRVYIQNLVTKAVQAEQERIKLFVNEEMLGCDGYERERDSVRCTWCGQTEYSKEHQKARLLATLKKGTSDD